MTKIHLIDPTAEEVNPSHIVCYGQCPKCRAFWSTRTDQSCDCFSPDSQDDKRQQWQLFVRRTVMDVIKSLSP